MKPVFLVVLVIFAGTHLRYCCWNSNGVYPTVFVLYLSYYVKERSVLVFGVINLKYFKGNKFPALELSDLA